MQQDELDRILRSAEAAVTHAQDVRAAHRKRTVKGQRSRELDISIATARLKRAMAPIRSGIARLAREWQSPNVDTAANHVCYRQLAQASQAIQRERRKLWKMKTKKGKPNGPRNRR